MSRKITKTKILDIILMMILIAVLAPLIWIAFYSRPCVDDFGYSHQLYRYIQEGHWNVIGILRKAFEVDSYYYNTWQGLYTSAFLLALQPAIFGEKFYCVGFLILLILIYVCIWYFVSTICALLKIETNKVLMALFELVVILQGLPSAVQGMYWFNGTWNYMPFLFLILVNTAIVLKYIFAEEYSDKKIIISIILSFIISGGNHVTAFLNILILVVLCAAAMKKKKWKAVLPLLAAVIGFAIVYFAPGTSIRQAYLVKQNVFTTLWKSLKQSIDYIFKWSGRHWILYIVSVVMASVYIYKKNLPESKYFKISPLLFIIIFWIMLCGMLCVPYMAMGNFGDDRLTNVIWGYYMTSTGIATAYTTCYLLNRYLKDYKIEMKYIVSIFAVCFIGATCYRSGNAGNAIRELQNGTANLYASVFDSRVDKMKQYNEIITNELPFSGMLRFDDVSDDLNDWRNRAWRSYYGVDIQAYATNWMPADTINTYIDNIKAQDFDSVSIIKPKETLKDTTYEELLTLEDALNMSKEVMSLYDYIVIGYDKESNVIHKDLIAVY